MIIKLLLFLYLTSSYLGAVHIHNNALDSIDCKIHILVKNLNSGDSSNNFFELFGCEGCFESILFFNSYYIYKVIKGFNAQAPPILF